MEIDKRECKICKQQKTRMLIGRYPNSKDKKFVNEHNVLWNGSTCPDCHREVTKTKQLERRRAAKDSKA